jgi:hypothetical protein
MAGLRVRRPLEARRGEASPGTMPLGIVNVKKQFRDSKGDLSLTCGPLVCREGG